MEIAKVCYRIKIEAPENDLGHQYLYFDVWYNPVELLIDCPGFEGGSCKAGMISIKAFDDYLNQLQEIQTAIQKHVDTKKDRKIKD